ncbi:MAG: hypothetical protein O3B24_05895 [Verrucomicrobia bacterium]|nr:hypothetical protein [Verrucomicrobiota bacterium]
MSDPTTRTPRRRLRRAIIHVVDSVIVILVLIGLYVAWVGIPNWMVRRCLMPSAQQAYALDVGRVRFSPLRGFLADDVRIFPRRQIGPALLEARRVEASASVLDAIMGRPMLSGLVIQNGLIRPGMLQRDKGDAKAGEAGAVDLAIRLVLKGVEVQGIWVNALEGDLTVDGDAWRLENAYGALQHRTQSLEVRGSIAQDRSGDLSGRGSADGDPAVLVPVFDAFRIRIGSKIIQNFAFPDTLPRGEWSFLIPGGAAYNSEVRFQLWMENPVYRGVDALRADVTVQLIWANSNLTADIRPMLIVRDEGVARGGLTIYERPRAKTRVLDFEVVSGIDPVAGAQMVGVWTNVVRTSFRFQPPYKLAGSGSVDLRDPKQATLDADLFFGLLERGGQPFRDCAFHYQLMGSTSTIDNVQATWFGGALQGRMELRPVVNGTTNTQFRMAMNVVDANFDQVAGTLLGGGGDAYSGALTGSIALDGVSGTQYTDSLRGSGELSIRKGRIFLLPVFGGLSDYLARTIPGGNMLIGQSDVRTAFTIDRGRMRTERLQVDGDVLSLRGKGSTGFDGTMDFEFQLTFLKSHTLLAKVVRVPTYVFSKLFEFRLTGTRREPQWYPINFSKELWQKRDSESKKGGSTVTNNVVMPVWDETW